MIQTYIFFRYAGIREKKNLPVQTDLPVIGEGTVNPLCIGSGKPDLYERTIIRNTERSSSGQGSCSILKPVAEIKNKPSETIPELQLFFLINIKK